MPVLTSSIRPGRLLALLGAIIAVTCVLPALAGAQESGDGPPFSFPGCTEQTDGTVDCGYSGSEDDVPPNCSRPDEGGQLTCYPGGIYADGSDPELSAPGGDQQKARSSVRDDHRLDGISSWICRRVSWC
jgi:hypothetical protein